MMIDSLWRMARHCVVGGYCSCNCRRAKSCGTRSSCDSYLLSVVCRRSVTSPGGLHLYGSLPVCQTIWIFHNLRIVNNFTHIIYSFTIPSVVFCLMMSELFLVINHTASMETIKNIKSNKNSCFYLGSFWENCWCVFRLRMIEVSWRKPVMRYKVIRVIQWLQRSLAKCQSPSAPF